MYFNIFLLIVRILYASSSILSISSSCKGSLRSDPLLLSTLKASFNREESTPEYSYMNAELSSIS